MKTKHIPSKPHKSEKKTHRANHRKKNNKK